MEQYSAAVVKSLLALPKAPLLQEYLTVNWNRMPLQNQPTVDYCNWNRALLWDHHTVAYRNRDRTLLLPVDYHNHDHSPWTTVTGTGCRCMTTSPWTTTTGTQCRCRTITPGKNFTYSKSKLSLGLSEVVFYGKSTLSNRWKLVAWW